MFGDQTLFDDQPFSRLDNLFDRVERCRTIIDQTVHLDAGDET